MSTSTPLGPAARRRASLTLVTVFLVGSLTTLSSVGEADIFPFSGWTMFSRVPGEVLQTEVRIVERAGRQIEAPATLTSNAATRARLSHRDRVNLGRLGHALDAGDQDATALATGALAHLFEPGDVVEVVETRFQPLERYRRNEAAIVRTLGHITVPQ